MSETVAGSQEPQQSPTTFAIIIRLSPEFTDELSRPGVVAAIAAASREGSSPTPPELVRLGQAPAFAIVFAERLKYLMDQKKVGHISAAGPFDGLRDGMYLCSVPDEQAARKIIENDPLYRAGFIEPDYHIRRWLVAI